MEDRSLIANRVFQLESQNLDHELENTIDKLVDELEVPRFGEEFKLILKIYLGASSINHNGTVGMQAYNLSFGECLPDNTQLIGASPKYKLVLLTACTLCGSYIIKRCQKVEKLIKDGYLGSLKLPWLTLDNIVLTTKSLNILNFLFFLRTGKYPTIKERIFGLVPFLSHQSHHDNVSMHKIQIEFMYREIIWKVLAEFLTTLIPLINIEQVKNQIFRTLGIMPKMSSNMKLSDKIKSETTAFKCGICNRQPFNPFIIGCRHVFCYYCIESKYLIDPASGFSCSLCKYSTDDELNVRRYRAIQAI